MVGPTNTLATAPIDHNKCLPHVLGCLKVRLGGSRRHDRKWLLGLSEHNERLVILLVGSCATVIESMQRIQKGTSIIQMLGCYYRVGCYKFSGILGTMFFCDLLDERKLMRPSLGRLEDIFDGGLASKDY